MKLGVQVREVPTRTGVHEIFLGLLDVGVELDERVGTGYGRQARSVLDVEFLSEVLQVGEGEALGEVPLGQAQVAHPAVDQIADKMKNSKTSYSIRDRED